MSKQAGEISVRHLGGDRLELSVPGHVLMSDQPVEGGGADTAPTPTELFVGSLAGCVAFYAHRYLVRHQLPTDGLGVTATYLMASRPARVSEIAVDIDLPENVPAERREGLLAVASHCTVHNTLDDPPVVRISLAADTAAA